MKTNNGVYQHFDIPEEEHCHCVYGALEAYPYPYGERMGSEVPFGAKSAAEIEQVTFITHSHINGRTLHRHMTSKAMEVNWPHRIGMDK